MIDVLTLQGKTQTEVIDLILDHGTQPIEVSVPKNTQAFFSDRDDIALDYAFLAYAGQLLHDVADTFEYEKVSPDLHASVVFSVTTTRMTELADVLMDIFLGYGSNQYEDEDDVQDIEEQVFVLRIEHFMDEVKAKKLKPACKYFYDMSVEYDKRKRKARS